MARPTGICRICGESDLLSFEHIPPKGAFNSGPVKAFTFDQIIDQHPLEPNRGKILQRGGGGYLLCEKCNNTTGDWYASEYISWSHQAALLLQRSSLDPQLSYIYHGYPLRFLKQIVTIFLTTGGERFHSAHPDLVKFVLNRQLRYFDRDKRIFAYYNPSVRTRQTGVSGKFDINGHDAVTVEFASYPFGFVLLLNGRVDSRLVDISYFADYDYNDWRSLGLKLPSFPVVNPYPGVYDTVASVRKMQITGEYMGVITDAVVPVLSERS